MSILETPYLHFTQDIERARNLLNHADSLAASELRNDIMRSVWMISVGALDACFCDAYADLIARTLQAKQIQPGIAIPKRLNNLRVPVVAFIRATANENWRWRVMARELIEDHSVLSIDNIKKLFNQFFSNTNKLLGRASFDSWLLHRDHKQRLFGISRTDYRATPPGSKGRARDAAKETFENRYERIFKRRHDCIHNCDRPKVAIDNSIVTTTGGVRKVIEDVEFLVNRCHEAFLNEYPSYLQRLGFNGVTRNRVGA